MPKKLLIFLINLRENIYKYINIFLDILFPPICILCEKIDKNWMCEKCLKKIEKLIKPKIILNKNILKITQKEKRNIKKFKMTNQKYNADFLYKILYIFKYKGIIRKIIIDYKFNDKPYICNFFSNIIINNKFVCDILKRYDIIISVPLSKKRLARRGYNQSDLIAKNISKKLNLEYKSNYLIKIKETEKQSTLKGKEREKNIKDAFVFNNKYNIENKNIIILDDVYTTGNTIKECYKILKKNGARKILALIIAKD